MDIQPITPNLTPPEPMIDQPPLPPISPATPVTDQSPSQPTANPPIDTNRAAVIPEPTATPSAPEQTAVQSAVSAPEPPSLVDVVPPSTTVDAPPSASETVPPVAPKDIPPTQPDKAPPLPVSSSSNSAPTPSPVPAIPNFTDMGQIDVTEPPTGIVAPDPLPPVSSGKGKMVGLIVLIFVLVGGGVAGAYYFLMNVGTPSASSKDDTSQTASPNTDNVSTEDQDTTSLTAEESTQSTDAGSTDTPPPTDVSADAERESDIKTLHGQIESFYAQNGFYPSLAHINNAEWRANNMKILDTEALIDPNGEAATLALEPAANVYAYTPGPEQCDNDNTFCATYSLTATLSDGQTYTKSNLN